jgi:hypothetical protein
MRPSSAKAQGHIVSCRFAQVTPPAPTHHREARTRALLGGQCVCSIAQVEAAPVVERGGASVRVWHEEHVVCLVVGSVVRHSRCMGDRAARCGSGAAMLCDSGTGLKLAAVLPCHAQALLPMPMSRLKPDLCNGEQGEAVAACPTSGSEGAGGPHSFVDAERGAALQASRHVCGGAARDAAKRIRTAQVQLHTPVGRIFGCPLA